MPGRNAYTPRCLWSIAKPKKGKKIILFGEEPQKFHAA